MANKLDREIVKGELVFLSTRSLRPMYRDACHRLVSVETGFGMHAYTMGTALVVTFVEDGERTRWHSMELDAGATVRFTTDLITRGPEQQAYEVIGAVQEAWRPALWRGYTASMNSDAMLRLTPADTWEG